MPVRWVDVEGRGGHFASMEQPELLLADVRVPPGLRWAGSRRLRLATRFAAVAPIC